MSLLDIGSPHQENISATLLLLQARSYKLSGLAAILDVPPIIVRRYIGLLKYAGYKIQHEEDDGWLSMTGCECVRS